MHHIMSRRVVPVAVAVMAAAGLSALSAPAAHAALPGTPGLLVGSKIVSGGGVTTATENPDGSRLVLHQSYGGSDQGGGAVWSPDGSSIAYVDGAPAVEMYLPNGTGDEFVTEGGADPTFTPDGSTIVEAMAIGPDWDTYQLASTAAAAHPTGPNPETPPAWFASPTGGSDRYPSVSVTTGEVVFEHDTDGASDIWTDHGDHIAGPLIANGKQPDVSPDGARIAFDRVVNGWDQLFVQAADGSGTATQVTSGATNHTYPKWTPDGLGLDYDANPTSDNYLKTTGHHLVLAAGKDTLIPGGLFSVTQQPTGPTPLGVASTFHPAGPKRLLDTRSGTGQVAKGAVPAGGTVALAVAGANSLPAKGITAAVLNVTVTAPTTAGHLAVYPEDTAVPSTSNLNWTAKETVSNLVTVPVGADGEVDLTNQSSGSTQVIADLQGYYTGDADGSAFTAVSPARILDTRSAVGIPTRTAIDDSTVKLAVRGKGGVAPDATAVALNLTAVGTGSTGYLEAYGDGGTAPTVSNVNWNRSGDTLAGLAIVPIGADGSVDIKVHGEAHVLADVAGYYGGSGTGSATGQDFVGVSPNRLLDTRSAVGVSTRTPLAAGHTLALQVTGGRTGVPGGATAVILNVTVTGTTGAGHLIAWADGSARPTSSHLNWTSPGQTVPNQVIVPVGSDGKADLFVSGTTHVIADVFGYFAG